MRTDCDRVVLAACVAAGMLRVGSRVFVPEAELWVDASKLQLFDLQYSDVRQERGLYNRLAARGRMARMTDENAITWAVDNPPEDTRAYFRGRCLRQYADSVAAASWDSVIFDIPGRESLQRVPTLEPLRGTKAHVGDLLDRCKTAGDLVSALTGQ